MPLNLDPSKFKATFLGEYTTCEIIPSQVNPGKEQLHVIIHRLKRTEGDELVRIPVEKECTLCKSAEFHNHQWFPESESPNSDLFKFIVSNRDHLNLHFLDPKQYVGHRATFEEIKRAGNTNPNTGLPGKDKTFYYPLGPVDMQEAEEPSPTTSVSPTTSTTAADSTTQAGNSTTTSQNGHALTEEDLLLKLADLADGKTLEEVRLAARSDSDIFSNKVFLFKVLSAEALKQLVDMSILSLGEGNKYVKAGF